MICNKCGKEILDGSVYCNKCGNKVNEVKKKSSILKIVILLILAFITPVLVIGIYAKFNPRTKNVSEVNNKISKAADIVPTSNFVHQEDVVFNGSQSNVQGWVSIAHRKDGLIPTTAHTKPEQAALEIFILIQNKGEGNINLTSSDFSLTLSDQKLLVPFEGEKWSGNFEWLSPQIIEVDGQDVSKQHLQQTTLTKDKYCVAKVAFPMNSRITEQQALDLCNKVEGVLRINGKDNIIVGLNKVK